MTNSKKMFIAFVVSVVASLLLVSTAFMPFITASEDRAEYYETAGDLWADEDAGIKVKDMKSPSIVSYISICLKMGMEEIGISLAIVLGIWGVFALLTLLFSFLKKAIPIIVFDILALLVFLLLRWDFTDRGVVGEYGAYVWGIANILYFLFAIILFAGAVFMLITKIKIKKENRNN